MRAEAALFHQLAVGGGDYVFAGVDQAFGKRQHIIFEPRSILPNEQHMVRVGHGNNHHRTAISPRQTLKLSLFPIREAQIQ